MDKTPSRHITWLDILKTLGMWTIVCYHFFAPVTSVHLSTVGVPLFFVVSGYLSKIEDSWPVFWDKLWRRLIVPYLLLCLIRIGINYAIWPGMCSMQDLLIAIGGIMLGFNKYNGTFGGCELWFVYCLLFVKIAFQMTKGGTIRTIAWIILSILYAYYMRQWVVFSGNTLWGMHGWGLGSLFFIIGYGLRRLHQYAAPKENWLTIALLTVMSGVLFWFCGTWNGPVGLVQGYYGHYFSLCLIGGVAGTLCLYGISRGLDALLCRLHDDRRFFFSLHSQGSIMVLAFHIPLVIWAANHPLCANVEWNACMWAILIQLVFTPLIALTARFLPVLLGNRTLNR